MSASSEAPIKRDQQLRWVWVLYGVSVLLVTLQKGLRHPGNFLLFRCTFDRLIHGQSLYLNTPGCSGYLYSPAFAFLFAPFALLPPLVGLFCWNAINAAAPALAISRLLDARRARIVLTFIYLDVVRSMQNSQSNALVAGLLVLTFLACERDRVFGAAFATGAGALIKIFPAAGGAFALVAPRPADVLLKRVAAFVAAGVLLALTPLLINTPSVLAAQYHAWLTTTTVTSVLRGESVLGILGTWFGYAGSNWPVQLVGLIVLLAPVIALRDAARAPEFRALFLSSLLVFVVIFNHQAESPSYVIATTGIGIWAVTLGQRWRVVLAILTLVLVSLVTTSLVPWHYRHDVFRAYSVQAVPCLLSWLGMQIDLWTKFRAPRTAPTAGPPASDDPAPAANTGP